MPILQNLESVPVEIHLAVKVHFMKGLHWYFILASVLGSV